jgi:hypothetical protein
VMCRPGRTSPSGPSGNSFISNVEALRGHAGEDGTDAAPRVHPRCEHRGAVRDWLVPANEHEAEGGSQERVASGEIGHARSGCATPRAEHGGPPGLV